MLKKIDISLKIVWHLFLYGNIYIYGGGIYDLPVWIKIYQQNIPSLFYY